jgi:hypothetical protein
MFIKSTKLILLPCNLPKKGPDGLEKTNDDSYREDDDVFDSISVYDMSSIPSTLIILQYAVPSVVHIIPSSTVRPSATSFVANVNNLLARVERKNMFDDF